MTSVSSVFLDDVPPSTDTEVHKEKNQDGDCIYKKISILFAFDDR